MKKAWLFGFLGLFCIAMFYVFFDVCSPWTVISSPDDAPYYPQNFCASQIENTISGNALFHPLNVLHLFNPITMHEVRYMIPLLLFALSICYYLRSLRVNLLPALGAGVLTAFSGYTFTLFCAGHLGYYWLLGTFFWSLGLVNNAFEKGALRHYVLLGAVVMWAQTSNPDVWMLCMILLAGYMLYRAWVYHKTPHIVDRLMKFGVTAIVAACIGFPGVHVALSQHLAGRDKQIAESSRSNGGEQATTPEAKQQQAEDRWIFATNWSLPPADCAELLIPGFFGDNAMTPPYPYWGALGRPYRFEPGKMMPNYRQHTTYLGLITVFLALVGLCGWGVKRGQGSGFRVQGTGDSKNGKLKAEEDQKSAGDDEALSTFHFSLPTYNDVPFWAGVWIICLVLALGRYTPVYRLFYAIPYMDYLRAPVKFLHFTELATGLLAGFGLQALLTQRLSEKALKRLLLAGGGFIVLFVVALLGVSANGTAIEKHIAEIGLGQVAPALRSYTSYNCLRAIGLMALVLVALYVGWRMKGGEKKITFLLCGLISVGVFDLAAVARRYVVPLNVRAHHEENAIVKEMKRATRGRPATTANYVTRNVSVHDWLNTSFSLNGFPSVLPDETDANSKVRPLAAALQKDPLRYWDLTGPRFVLLSRQQASQVIQMQLAKPVAEFEMGQGFVRRSASPSEQSILLLERTRQPVYPCVFFNWTGGIQPDDQIGQLIKLNATAAPLTSAALLVSDAPVPATSAELPVQGVAFTQMRGEKNVLVSRATLQLPQAGLLVWNERYSADLVAAVDGQEVPLYQANGQWCAVQVPAGQHTVTCKVRVKNVLNLLSMAASILVLVACAAATVLSQRTQKR